MFNIVLTFRLLNSAILSFPLLLNDDSGVLMLGMDQQVAAALHEPSEETCSHCFLRLQLGDVAFHPDGFAKNCFTHDVLKLYGLSLEIFGDSTGCIKDSKWLYKCNSSGLLNIWTAIVDFCIRTAQHQ